MYFAQEVGGLPSTYRFAIDYCGPYSRGLAFGLGLSGVLGYTTIAGGTVSLLPAAHALLQEAADATEFSASVSRIVGELSAKPATTLGLLALVHFVSKHSTSQSRDDVVEAAHALKPNRDLPEIAEAYDGLCELGWL